ncbi:unnamed protein product [Lactuca virosa]|uniref:Uncharacterized protein n=1 Tax=Lactuca virosa TaxID=75947 RepID=A0AAU9PGN1_9ASTR|nr:unnamed protein product [Lactuca virosa]
MQEPITTLFSSQVTRKSLPGDEDDDENVMVSFAELQFNPEENDIPDELIMSGKQLRIINSKINSLLQITVDTRGKNYVTGVEMDYLLKSQESRLRNLIEVVEPKQEERLVTHSKSFYYEIQKLRDVAQERHEFFMEKVNATKESLDLKVSKIKSLMSEEVKKLEENYKLLHGKVDVIIGAITHLVKFDNEYTKEFQANSKPDEKVFEKVEEFLSGIKDTFLKVDLSNQSNISQESISMMVSNIKSNIKDELATILSLVLRLPTNARAAQILQGEKEEVEEIDLQKFMVMI